jgi:hypothetical protein
MIFPPVPPIFILQHPAFESDTSANKAAVAKAEMMNLRIENSPAVSLSL